MKLRLRTLHRWIGLSLACLWLVQAGTGVLMVYHWELDDALLAAPRQPVSFPAIGQRMAALTTERPRSKVLSLYPTGGGPDRFDIFVLDADGHGDVVRVDGAGHDVITRPSNYDYGHAGLINAAVILHQSFFAGHLGRRLLGVSGIFLLGSLAVGIYLAWPPRGRWRAVLLPRGAPSGVAWWYAWHRAVGAWLAIPALVFLTAGVLLAFDDPLKEFLDAAPARPALVANPAAGTPIGPAAAIATALARFPGSTFSGMSMPSAEDPWYRVRVKQPGERRRVFGTTAVSVAAAGGAVLSVEDARAASWRRAFLDVAYPLHTGEYIGWPGRLVALGSGLLLLASMTLGTLLWWWRRRAAPPRRATV